MHCQARKGVYDSHEESVLNNSHKKYISNVDSIKAELKLEKEPKHFRNVKAGQTRHRRLVKGIPVFAEPNCSMSQGIPASVL